MNTDQSNIFADDLCAPIYDDGYRQVSHVGPTTAGGAYARYAVAKLDGEHIGEVVFQHDTIPNVGVVGFTNECLLAIVRNRLQCFQAGGFECDENADAITAVCDAIRCLEQRTASRKARGVEGTHVK